MLADLPDPPLHDTIPDFHHTPKRFAALERAIAADSAGRDSLAAAEIEFALRRKAMTSILLDAGLPQRVTHNDTKLNNVLFDDATGEGYLRNRPRHGDAGAGALRFWRHGAHHHLHRRRGRAAIYRKSPCRCRSSKRSPVVTSNRQAIF